MVCIARFEKPYYSDPVHTAEQAKIAAAKTYKWRRAHETKPSFAIQPIITLPEPVATPEPTKSEPIWPANQQWFYDDRHYKLPPRFVHHIKSLVCLEFSASVTAINSTSRLRSIVIPRHISIYLCCELTFKSLSELGRLFDRDHTTIIAAIRRTKKRMHQDAYLCRLIVDLQDRIEQELENWRNGHSQMV